MMKKRSFLNLFFLLFLIFLAFSSFSLLFFSCVYAKIEDDNINQVEKPISDEISTGETTTPEEEIEVEIEPTNDINVIENIKEIEEVLEEPEKILEIKEEYLKILDINTDIVGKIYIENTNVNQYVFFTDNNKYYLNHDMYGRENKYGAVFMDMVNHGVIPDKNTILHGHNFGDKLFFCDIVQYKNQNFFEKNKIIHFDTLYNEMIWEVFAAYTTTVEDYFIQTEFKNDEEFFDYVERIKNLSVIKSDYTPKETDRLLTLHTCSFEFKDAHTLVYAYLVEKK